MNLKCCLLEEKGSNHVHLSPWRKQLCSQISTVGKPRRVNSQNGSRLTASTAIVSNMIMFGLPIQYKKLKKYQGNKQMDTIH